MTIYCLYPYYKDFSICFIFKYYSYRYYMHQTEEYPVYKSSNYEALNHPGVSIKISQELRQSSSAENY